MACQKAQGFLGKAGTTVNETVDARKERYEGADALALLDGIDTLIATRGKSIASFDLKKDRPADEVLLSHLLGPSGNLRAPPRASAGPYWWGSTRRRIGACSDLEQCHFSRVKTSPSIVSSRSKVPSSLNLKR